MKVIYESELELRKGNVIINSKKMSRMECMYDKQSRDCVDLLIFVLPA